MTIKREIGIGYLIFTLNVLVMIYVVAHNFVKPECLDAFKALSLELITGSRQEAGNCFYDLNTDSVDPYRLTFIEGWKSGEALEAHQQTPHFTTILPQLKEMCVSEGEITQYFPLEM